MNNKSLRSDMLLFITAAIWGSAFVAQIMGMKSTGPFIFNGIRFMIGAVFLIPFVKLFSGNKKEKISCTNVISGIITGTILFAGATFQQVGIISTTAGNAGFITGLYVLIVPVIALFMGFKPEFNHIIGIIFAFTGMYLLSIPAGSSFTEINKGDLLVFSGAFFWALHVVVIGKFSPGQNPILLSIIQFLTCSILSLAAAVIFEQNTIYGILQAKYSLLYSGLISVGIAYTLQVIAQKNAPPTHAVIILTLEGVFAAIAGWLVLDETFTVRQFSGSVLMFSGMIMSQIRLFKLKKLKS
ncbi:MAG: DMT family transporter [Spirochaetes bacterium]|nr:DMT family transporter [Spirochaetota bacterium]